MHSQPVNDGAVLAAVSPVAIPLPDLFIPVPDPVAHTGNKVALVALRLLELGASSFHPILHFIAEGTLASVVRQGLDLLYKEGSECHEVWFAAERAETALLAKIPHVNAYKQTKVSFNWGWRCKLVFFLSPFLFALLQESLPLLSLIFPQTQYGHMKADFKPMNRVTCKQQI